MPMPTPTLPATRRGVPAIVLTALFGILVTGCGAPPVPPPEVGSTTAEEPDDAALRTAVDQTLDWTYENRHLNLQEHAAWQILHGALTFKRAFPVRKEPGGESVSAVDHVLAGGTMNGWTVRPGIVLDAATDRRGLIAEMEPGTKTGQGHSDQWLAILAQCDLPPSQTILAGDRTFTMEDFVRQVQWDVPRNVNQEYSWTLIGLTTYLPTTSSWTAQDEQTWSIERLVEIETQQDLATSACGGTHRLIGLSMALNRHLAAGHEMQGVWAAANEKIQEGIEAARQYQNTDGSFSSNYFQRGGRAADLAQDLGVSGHILEFLVLAMTDEQLSEPWVKRAVMHLCDVFHKTRPVPLECGALYHAAHGLALYRDRVFGPRQWPHSTADTE